GAADYFLRFSPESALDQLAGRTQRASGSNTVSLKSSRWGCGTRRALRGFSSTFSDLGLTQGVESTSMSYFMRRF
ncbi:MAG: hypothetical protein WB402_00145, partial [Sulfuricaulis sp.]|uniref:hypothetical protein n=1 Tax=Sulfuricaulis sp. TaxID=2003553 RepID=UPI003C31DD72